MTLYLASFVRYCNIVHLTAFTNAIYYTSFGHVCYLVHFFIILPISQFQRLPLQAFTEDIVPRPVD